MTLVALIDGALAPGHPALEGRIVLGAEPGPPATAHAEAVAAAILAHAPEVRIRSIAVFGATLATDAATLARALGAAEGADIVHCSLGLARNDPAVAAALARLSGTVVAASPARGAPVWPASLPGVVAVQGDARCGPDAWSLIDPSRPLYGACPRSAAHPAVAGASIAAAHLTGHLARHGLAALEAGASWLGRERRTG